MAHRTSICIQRPSRREKSTFYEGVPTDTHLHLTLAPFYDILPPQFCLGIPRMRFGFCYRNERFCEQGRPSDQLRGGYHVALIVHWDVQVRRGNSVGRDLHTAPGIRLFAEPLSRRHAIIYIALAEDLLCNNYKRSDADDADAHEKFCCTICETDERLQRVNIPQTYMPMKS